MTQRDLESRADELELRLKRSQSLAERKEIFKDLSRIYAPDHLSAAVKWAFIRKAQNPLSDGQTAYSDAFAGLVKQLPDLRFEERTLNLIFRERIWLELCQRSRHLVHNHI